MSATRPIKRAGHERWLYRTERGDYGPVTTDQILDGIRERKIDLATQVSVLGTNKWGSAGEFPLFRDHYAVCLKRWETEALHAEAEAIGKRMELKGHASRGAGLLLITGIVVGLGFGAFVVYKLLKAEPLGLDKIVRMTVVDTLPKPMPISRAGAIVPLPKEKKIARLSEPESYDISGVHIEGTVDTTNSRTQMAFDENGEIVAAEGISGGDLARIVESARQNLYGCARDAAARNAAFAGTDVGFTVSPGRLTKVTVGADARGNAPFMACVKVALGRVQVPGFQGNEKRVSVPLRFQR